MEPPTHAYTKRRLVFEVVKAALAKGFPPEKIAKLAPAEQVDFR